MCDCVAQSPTRQSCYGDGAAPSPAAVRKGGGSAGVLARAEKCQQSPEGELFLPAVMVGISLRGRGRPRYPLLYLVRHARFPETTP